jgi:hypothetical protein
MFEIWQSGEWIAKGAESPGGVVDRPLQQRSDLSSDDLDETTVLFAESIGSGRVERQDTDECLPRN